MGSVILLPTKKIYKCELRSWLLCVEEHLCFSTLVYGPLVPFMWGRIYEIILSIFSVMSKNAS